MRTLRSAIVVILALTFAMLLGCSSTRGPDDQAKFDALVKGYVEATFAFNPSTATMEGFHAYDDSLENWTPDTISAEEQRIRNALHDLAGISPAKLNPAAQIDYDLFQRGAERDLF